MATRSNAPVEAVPAIGALGQEAVVAAALAEPQIPEVAAQTDLPLPAAADQLAAAVGETGAPAGDAVPPPLAADPAGPPSLPDAAATTSDLAPVMGALPPTTTEAAVGHITVTTLSPDLGGLPFAPLSPLFTAPLSSPALHGGFGSFASTPVASAPLHTSPQDHALIVPPSHPDAAAPVPVVVAASPPSAVPTAHPTASAPAAPHIFEPFEAGASIATSGPTGLNIVIGPPAPNEVVFVEQGPNGSWTFKEGAETLVLSPGSHGTIGTGQYAYAIDLGQNGSLSITNLNPTLGVAVSGGSLTLTSTGAITLGHATVGGDLTITSNGNIVPTGFVTLSPAAGYSFADHSTLTVGHPGPHLHT